MFFSYAWVSAINKEIDIEIKKKHETKITYEQKTDKEKKVF